jgi:hypothetical protein
MLIINFERHNALAKRGMKAFSRRENFKALRSELLEAALAIDEILEKGETPERLEAAGLEGIDVTVMLNRVAHILGWDNWALWEPVKLTKGESKCAEREESSGRPPHGLE